MCCTSKVIGPKGPKAHNKIYINIHILKIIEFRLYFLVGECPENEVRWVLIGLEEIQQSG